MCGIFGWSLPKDANITPEQRFILARALATMNDVRGGDSWGIAVLNGSFSVSRGLGEAWKTAPFKEFHLDEAEVMFGHTRRATTGDKTIPNSHPFEIANKNDPSCVIIGAHNGVICEHEKLNKKYDRKFEVDSMHIFAHIADGLPTRELAGYGACEFVHGSDPSTVKLFRFNAGELSVAGLPDKDDVKGSKGVIWSSSSAHLDTAIRIAGLADAFSFAMLETEKIYEVTEGKLFNTKQPIVFGPSYVSQYSGAANGYGNYNDNGVYVGGTGTTRPFHGRHSHYSSPGFSEGEATDEFEGEGGQDSVWGKNDSGTPYVDVEIWESENYVVTRRKTVTTLMKKSNEDETPSPQKLENEPTAPDEAKEASKAIVAELSSARA